MIMRSVNVLLFLISVTVSSVALSSGNETIQSFSKAKKFLQNEVYFDHRKTIYCDATFNSKKEITLPAGYQSDKYIKRSKRVEWEHVVPAENFGRTFVEWREGTQQCINKKGDQYKGRRCANKASAEYRLMQSDLYNLFPAIGSINAMRSNYNFTMLPGVASDFGLCRMKVDSRKAEPPVGARGRIGRAYLYMDQTYSRYRMSKSQKQLMSAWDKQYPVSEWECQRAERIKNIQGNVNAVLAKRCF